VADPIPVPASTRVAIALCLAVGASWLGGCSLVPLGQGDRAAPILITGRVAWADGRAVSDARLNVEARSTGTTFEKVVLGSFGTDADGTFELHVAPSAELRSLANANGGFVNFILTGLWSGDPMVISSFGFSREINGDAWTGTPPAVVLQPGKALPGDAPGSAAPTLDTT
jgi:hypothetical protein